MSNSLFDEQAIETAAKAIFNLSVYRGYDDETLQSEWLRMKNIMTANAKAALEAATASLRERGKLTAQVPSGADCHPESPHASIFTIRHTEGER